MLKTKSMLIWLFVLSLSVSFKAQTHGSPTLPDTIAGKRVAAYIKAFNTGDEQAVRQFFTENVSAAALAERPLNARAGVYERCAPISASFSFGALSRQAKTR
jgi:hypothetical protein